jgi:hypothetical protein
VPDIHYPFAEAITVTEGLATNPGHRTQVEDIRKRHHGLRPRNATPGSLPMADIAHPG